jgi:catecholate siderophore receptor
MSVSACSVDKSWILGVALIIVASQLQVSAQEVESKPTIFKVSVSEATGYTPPGVTSGMKDATPLRDSPQSVTVIPRQLVRDQLMLSIGDVTKFVPGIQQHQGENNRDQVIIRGNNSSADFYLNGVRDDAQYFRDLYNLEQVEAIKGPNAMIFGRGGGGGVIHRVTKTPETLPMREIVLLGGSFGTKRVAGDLNQPVNGKLGFRLNAMYEDGNSFRNHVGLQRHAINPVLSFLAGPLTRLTLSFEHLQDDRIGDRGISSFQGRPVKVDPKTFFGNPNDSWAASRVNVAAFSIEHRRGTLLLVNRSNLAHYDRSYQNYVPGAVNATQTLVPITAYNNATLRQNLFNQTNATYTMRTGRIRHNFLAGVEIGTQRSDNLRNTGYFNNSTTTVNAPLELPLVNAPITFRQNPTDADNHVQTRLGAVFAQDQVELSRWVQLVGGVRVDQFDLRYRNNRNGDALRRIDNLVSPRAGVIVKPTDKLSVYGSYTVSYLPSSGDQFAALTDVTQQVKPEKFSNYEAGVKWDARRDTLSLSLAVYRLDRTNTRSTDPNDPTRIVQTGSARTNGVEAGVSGNLTRRWMVAGGYAYQDAYISSATAAASLGAQVGQVPRHTFSLWNNYRVTSKLGFGFGVVSRAEMFAAVDNAVLLPGYARLDGAVYYVLREGMRLQVNAENLGNVGYYANADSNTNISPGKPRSLQAAIAWKF